MPLFEALCPVRLCEGLQRVEYGQSGRGNEQTNLAGKQPLSEAKRMTATAAKLLIAVAA